MSDGLKIFFGILGIIGILVIISFIDPEETRYEIINGHDFIIFDQYKNDDYVHSPDCWCMKDTL